MTDKYSTYKAEDYVQDDIFIASALNRTEASDEFWDALRYSQAIDTEEELLARKIIDSVRVEQELLPEDEKAALWRRIEQSNKQELLRSKRRTKQHVFAAAGAAAVALLTLLVVKSDLFKTPQQIASQPDIEHIDAPNASASANIQLVLGQNRTVTLEGDETYITYKDEKIVIETAKKGNKGEKKEETKTEVAYNQLIVPLGKRASLTLPDSSRLIVNAGSRVVYPVMFTFKHREVFIDGEAYIEVAKDPKRAFIVKTDRLTLEALGTAFDVNTYRQDSVHYIALVEGSVRVSRKDGSGATVLKPNELYACDGEKYNVTHVNPDYYTSWKDGVLQYDSEPLGNIIRRLTRYYGQSIECTREAAVLRCSGKLDLQDDLLKVLQGIAMTAPVEVVSTDDKRLLRTSQ
jgi:ferric-dicitrate binding protein FerR (iron transport regulator)